MWTSPGEGHYSVSHTVVEHYYLFPGELESSSLQSTWEPLPIEPAALQVVSA